MPFDNTPPSTKTPALAAAFSNTGPSGKTPGMATAFDNTASAPALVVQPEITVRCASDTDIGLNAPITGAMLDGITLGVSDVILVWTKSNKALNGIYLVNAGSPPTRHSSFNENTELNGGCRVKVTEGTLYGGKKFVLATPAPIVIGTTLLDFVQQVAPPNTPGLAAAFNNTGPSGKTPGLAAAFDNTASVPAKVVQPEITVRCASDTDIGLNAPITGAVLDGITLAASDVILVWTKSNKALNGIYVVNAGVPPTRHTSFNESSELNGGCRVKVTSGTVYGGKKFVLATQPPIVIGTTLLDFVQLVATPK